MLGLSHVVKSHWLTVTRYAMCDSPIGLLVFVMKGLRLLAPRIRPTPEQVITFTNLAWLPGPEYAMRFWAHCAKDDEAKRGKPKKAAMRPQVGITVFLGGENDGKGGDNVILEEHKDAIQLDAPTKVENGTRYACPSWAKTRYSVLSSQRVSGEPGLLAWERPEVILTGVQSLARGIKKVDKRLQASSKPATYASKEVVAPTETKSSDGGLKPPDRPALEQGDSSRTQVASEPPSSPKGKGAADAPVKEGKSPIPKDDNNDVFGGGGTPDTVILVSPPKDGAAK